MSAEEWTTLRLGEVCEFTNGFAFKSSDYVPKSEETIEVFRMGYISRGGGFKEDNTPVYVPRNYPRKLDKFLLSPGDITIAMTDMKNNVAILGNTARVTHSDRFVLNQRVGAIRVTRPDLLHSRFLYFYSNWEPHVEFLRSRANSGVQVNLSTSAIKDVELVVPPLQQQARIAEILGTLDDKIELNRRMNETLEAMARRLFKSWFVDFDPVHAKATLRRQHPKLSNADLSRRALPNMNPEIAELFPDEFEDSTIGPIPKGWSTRALYDIARFVNGAAFKGSDFCDPAIGKPVIKIAELKTGIDAQTKFSQKDVGSDREIHCGDTLYSWSGSPDTSLATFRWTGRDGLLNQHIFKVITENRPDEIFAYYKLNVLRNTLVEIARDKQTTGLGHVTVADMKRLHVIHPARELLQAFANQVGAIYDQSFNLSVDSLTLERTRDKLLPRLLSGELSVEEGH